MESCNDKNVQVDQLNVKKIDQRKDVFKMVKMLERNSKIARSVDDTRNMEDFDLR